MLVIGLTGGIGCGKSTVAELFANLHINIIDADHISHELSAPTGAAYEDIIKRFGTDIIHDDGTIDRKHLRDIVFNDPAKLKQLEQILHPKVRQRIATLVDAATSPYCIVVVPLLVETGMMDRFNRILVVDCEPVLQLQRIRQRDHVSEEQIRHIMARQADRESRLAAADDVIRNNSDREHLQQQVEKLHRYYLSLAAHSQ
jgi:dephospho-CoA kinase